jgi:cation transport regulator ChaB
MKKPILIASLALLCLTVKAQIKDTIGLSLPIVNGEIMHEGIVDVPGKTKNQLFQSAKNFLLEAFVSAKAVIETEDKEDGVLNCKAIHPVVLKLNFMYNGYFNDEMIIQINCKDGKYRYRFYDFRLSPIGFVGDTPNRWPSATYVDLLNDLSGKGKTHYSKKQEIFLIKDNENAVKDLIARLYEKMTVKAD